MVMDLIRGKGKDAPGAEEHVTEVEAVRDAIGSLETQIAKDEATLASLEEERGANRYKRECSRNK